LCGAEQTQGKEPLLPNYELTYILRPLEEATLTATNNRINTIITNAGGEVVHRNDWGRRRLAYPIRKINDGYYTTLNITLPGSAVRGVERSLQLIDDVQRYLVVRVDAFATPGAPSTPVAAAPTQAPAAESTEPANAPAPEAVAQTEAAPAAQAEQTESSAVPAATEASASTQAPTPETA
jgi:small subunit ribosomal protein S6